MRIIQRIVRNSATAEDLVHDSFVTLIGRELDPSPRDQVADLTRIAQNLALDHRRREARMAKPPPLIWLMPALRPRPSLPTGTRCSRP